MMMTLEEIKQLPASQTSPEFCSAAIDRCLSITRDLIARHEAENASRRQYRQELTGSTGLSSQTPQEAI